MKCRCLFLFNRRMSVTYDMKGSDDFHMSLSTLMYPSGLHRFFYKVIFDEGNVVDLVLVKYRRRHDFRDRWY